MKLLGGARGKMGGGQGRNRGKLGIGVEVSLRGNLAGGGTPGDFTNGATDDFTIDANLNTGTFQKGANWAMYKDAVLALGATAGDIIEDASNIAFQGTAVAPFLSLFDVVHVELGETIRWPGITPRFIKRIKDLAATQKRAERRGLSKTHVVVFTWKDDMEVGLKQSSLWNHYFTGFKSPNYYMVGTGPNAYGCANVDLDEDQPWVPAGAKCLASGTEEARPATSNHHILLDYRVAGFGRHAARLAREQWDNYWTKAGSAGVPPDAFMAHDIRPHINLRGVPTNRPSVDNDAWEKATNLVVTEHAAAFAGLGSVSTLWAGEGRMTDAAGNPWPLSSTAKELPSLRAVYWNFIFGDLTLSQIMDQVDWAAARNYEHVCLGVSNIGAPNTTMLTENGHAGWWEVLTRARNAEFEDRITIAIPDRGTGSTLFWHPAMRPVL
jgi:hypothetical protein